MAVGTDEMWDLMIQGSDELALELGLRDFSPRALSAIDQWLERIGGASGPPLGDEQVARLGCLLARILIESHGGGLVVIRRPDHPLDGEWAVTGFAHGLANDYHVPFMISAARIGIDHSLSARAFYQQLRDEGR
jgi:hypothetical protein